MGDVLPVLAVQYIALAATDRMEDGGEVLDEQLVDDCLNMLQSGLLVIRSDSRRILSSTAVPTFPLSQLLDMLTSFPALGFLQDRGVFLLLDWSSHSLFSGYLNCASSTFSIPSLAVFVFVHTPGTNTEHHSLKIGNGDKFS